MNIFEKLKAALESDVSFDIKLDIQGAYFSVILEARDNGNPKEYYRGQAEPSSITVRYCIVSDEAYMPIDELIDGEALSFTDLHIVKKVMDVLYDSKKEINDICGLLCGEDREYNMCMIPQVEDKE